MKTFSWCLILFYFIPQLASAEGSNQCRKELHLVPLEGEQAPPIPRNQQQALLAKTYQILDLKEELAPSDYVEHIKYLEQTLQLEHVKWEERLFQGPTASNWVKHHHRLIKLKFIIAIYYAHLKLGSSFENLERDFFQFVKQINYQNPRYHRSFDKEGNERPLDPLILEDFAYSLMSKLPSKADHHYVKMGRVLSIQVESP